MLSNKQYVFLVTFIILLSAIGYFFSCTSSSSQQMNVQLLWQHDELDCQAKFNGGKEDKAWLIEQFQFYISEIEFGSEKSGWQKINLAQTPFQAHDTVLLGTDCRAAKHENNTVKKGNWTIEFETNAKVILNESSRIRFKLGVPFAVNHLNPISQKSPLNVPAMFWVWQTGHKFMRLELAASNAQWLFHLGSTGCKSASVMRSPEQACRYPNTFNVELPMTKDEGNQLVLNVDLAALLNNVDLTPSSSCQSEQDKVSCQQLFENLSLVDEIKSTTADSSVFKATKMKRVTVEVGVE